MKVWWLLGVFGLGMVLTGGWIAWLDRCDQTCVVAEEEAAEVFQLGHYGAALERIDVADARCGCERFTEGDAPRQYTLAQAALREMFAAEQGLEASRILAGAQGPILRELRAGIIEPAP